MKYIRTKDGIYEVVDNLYENGTWYYRKDNQAIPFRDNQYKQADTIEELCDAVFYYDCDLECMQIFWLKWKKVANFKRHFDYVKMGGEKDVKGAILTDKGLIYVAKMNDKGKLELI